MRTIKYSCEMLLWNVKCFYVYNLLNNTFISTEIPQVCRFFVK